ncbi:hypothetical protein C1645_832475 [Glomus cerebriforme]|uniref:Uncharacterized protein n=1 Tax=Glomus cerebriforme TaxID=658196 RepID=A0A397SN68_9GLOM|nr:hypothetical protein C1645_832475 [Glomus cerebriforme]
MFDFDQFRQKTYIELKSKIFCPSFADLIDGLREVSNKYTWTRVWIFKFFVKDNMKICSFLENRNTLVVLQTKTLCFAMAALASCRLIIIFTPLKALIDNHVNRLVRVGISAAGLYVSTGQFFEYQNLIVCLITAILKPEYLPKHFTIIRGLSLARQGIKNSKYIGLTFGSYGEQRKLASKIGKQGTDGFGMRINVSDVCLIPFFYQ